MEPVTRGSASADREEAQQVETVLALVREHGGRITSARRLLLQAIFEADGHRTAEELAGVVRAKAPDTHRSTIYRNLEDLEELGVIFHAHLGHGPATYHVTTMGHGHLVCDSCGAMVEAPDDLFTGLSTSASSRFGFAIDPRHFAVLGRCSACQ
jgi:Fur family transcriptional regulator, ferric uptake regulator